MILVKRDTCGECLFQCWGMNTVQCHMFQRKKLRREIIQISPTLSNGISFRLPECLAKWPNGIEIVEVKDE